MAESGTGAHILVFPYPAPGHMLPLLDLTHHLAIRGLSITILVTPKNLSILTPLLSNHPVAIKTLILPFPSHPSIPTGVENAKDMPFSAFNHFMLALGDLHDPILDWFHNHPSPPVAILSDLFLGWTNHLAGELGIRRYVFSPTGALGLSVINSLWCYFPKRDDPTNENSLISFPNISNSLTFPWWQLSSIYRSYVKGDPTWEFVKDGLCANMASWGVVVNSFTELDRVYFDHIIAEFGHDRVFAVGPLLPPANNVVERGGSGSSEVMSWLDTCAARTVVFVSFGSQFVLTNKQMERIALGLERSGVKFVWAVKGPTGGHDVEEYGKIPAGFENRVAGRGLVVRGWVPQVAILSHESVAALLTHCGWNSVLEAVVAGVLLLTWPMSADNFSNAKLLHELGIGIKACEGGETVPDPVEFTVLLRKSVSEETRVERNRVAKFAVAAKKAVGEGGSSWRDLDRLVLNLSQ
ncbi:hypothetical protein L6452_34220 [Arctium lappa]|uniref:Uncharacterized protein n=1 Tax=Arctium lappa TaxID=4217 RepID=A0ACB8YIT4_ARCLA|nr:hypothetical protein L6452_34220 [Arctium lappa]